MTITQHRTLVLVAALVVLLVAFAGCGGDSKKTPSSGIPKLANSPIATITPVEPTVTVCGPTAELPFPDDFPKTEITVPPDFIVWTVERSPHLRIFGTVTPPEDQAGRQPWQVVSDALLARLHTRGWETALNDKIEGRDFDIKAPDGRMGHFLAQPRTGCTGTVNLTYDINWIAG